MDEPTETAAPETAAPEPEEDGGVRGCATCGTEFGVNLAGDAERGVPAVPAGTRLACPVCRSLC